MINELTPAQEKMLPKYRDKWLKIGLSTKRLDKDKATEALSAMYRNGGMEPPPAVEFFNSPHECILRARELGHTNCTVNDFYWGNHDAASMAFYDFFKNEVPDIKNIEKIVPLIEASKALGWVLLYDTIAICSQRPKRIKFDAEQRLHSLDGPAIFFGKGVAAESNVYAVHGVKVKPYIVDNPEKITTDLINSETNIEVKRIMIDQYGQGRYLEDSKATVVNQDDYGTLYHLPVDGDEDIWMVKVVNSTAEPDGTFKDYFLRVQPNAYGGLKTAQAAVASTWRDEKGEMVFAKPEDYNLDFQS
jgi:hypothetical protein